MKIFPREKNLMIYKMWKVHRVLSFLNNEYASTQVPVLKICEATLSTNPTPKDFHLSLWKISILNRLICYNLKYKEII